MNGKLPAIVTALVTALCVRHARATDRYYQDISEQSPSRRYKVEAVSPDNRPVGGRPSFQSDFSFTCTDLSTGKILWNRNQVAKNEAPPVALFVSDSAWTVIWTGWNHVICIDREGVDRGKVDLLKDAFTETERDKFVHDTTAGPMWSGYSLWYFLDVDGRNFFVIRPWWGRRILIDVELGGLTKTSRALSKAITVYEHDYVMSELAKGVRTRKEWEKDGGPKVWPILDAAFLAGSLRVTEAIPDLLKLQDSTYSGSSTSGGLSSDEKFDGEVDPHTYSTFRMRRVVHLSLRRLGKAPESWPVHEFEKRYADSDRDTVYVPKLLKVARQMNADSVRKGMKAEPVLDLLGAPDFVGYDTWEYDMDTAPAYTLILKWDVRSVTGIERRSPALWQQGLVRDDQIAN